MNEVLNVRRVDGYAKGTLTIKQDKSKPSQASAPKLAIEDADGTVATLDFAKLAGLNLLGADTIADSTATVIADLVTDFNALLAALRTAKVIL